MKNDRKSNFEVLRIIAIIMVIALHFNNRDIGGALKYSEAIPLNFATLKFIESLSVCAVNIFVLLSAFFLVDQTSRKVGKIISLFCWVIFYQLLFMIIPSIINNNLNINQIIVSFIPKNYYVILYATLFIISPYINILIKSITKEVFHKLLLIVCLLFLLEPTIMDALLDITKSNWPGVSTISLYGSQSGYTIVNFVVLYIFAAYIKRYGLFYDSKKQSKLISLVGFLITSVIICLFSFLTETFWNYCNIFVVLQSIFLFDFFRKVSINNNKVINYIASSTFGIYIIHLYLLGRIVSRLNIAVFCKNNIGVMMMYTVLVIIITFVLSLMIDNLFKFMITPIAKLWKRSKLYNFNSIKNI